jgi:hypothetical protein
LQKHGSKHDFDADILASVSNRLQEGPKATLATLDKLESYLNAGRDRIDVKMGEIEGKVDGDRRGGEQLETGAAVAGTLGKYSSIQSLFTPSRKGTSNAFSALGAVAPRFCRKY